MNKKLIASEVNQDLVVQASDFSVQSYDTPSGKKEYYVEGPGINFQTPHKDAELNYEDLWAEPGDRYFVFAEIKLENVYFGNSTFQKKYTGKEFTINLEDKVYKGEFKEGLINLSLVN